MFFEAVKPVFLSGGSEEEKEREEAQKANVVGVDCALFPIGNLGIEPPHSLTASPRRTVGVILADIGPLQV